MRTLFHRKPKQPGLLPGSLVHAGVEHAGKVRVTVMNYDERRYEERRLDNIDEAAAYKNRPGVTWINVDGVHDVSIIEKLGNFYGIHPLVLEDILHTEQRPKVEDYETFVYVVIRMLYLNAYNTGNGGRDAVSDEEEEESDAVGAEQMSVIVGENFVITFQEEEGDIFDPIRERIRNDKGRIRKTGADYLAYSLLDIIVDNYFVVLESVGERISDLEEELVANPDRDTLRQIHDMKSEMIFLRKSVWPLREVISRLERGESDLFKKSTLVYLRDIYDHTIQVIDTIEGFRDTLGSMLDIYLSSISNRMNEIMKVLTIIATIFIPLTFITGIYGMNFQYMPERDWHYGYFATLSGMFLLAIGMLAWFWHKKWI